MRKIARGVLSYTMLKFAPRFFYLMAVLFPYQSAILRPMDRLYAQNTQQGDSYFQTPAYSIQSPATAPVATTGTASSVTYNSAVLRGIVNAHGLSTTAWFQYQIVNGSSKITVSTQTIIGTNDTEISLRISELLPGTTYYYRLVAKNDSGATYGNEQSLTTADINTSAIATEITPPVGAISINRGAYCANSLTITVNLSATDNTGVTGYYLSVNATPPSQYTSGWTSVTPTDVYQEDVSYTLSNIDGRNTVYAWYKDASGNISDRASASIVVDTTPPAITITNPTSDQAYTTANGTISLSGSASDNLNEINSVLWTNSRRRSDRERHAIDWTIPDIDLSKGENIITIKAIDSVGNTGIAKITITYSADNTAPVVQTGPASSITADLATLNGTINPMGLSATVWFQYGTSSGSYSGTTSIQSIEPDSNTIPISNRISELQTNITYYYRLVAQNSAGAASGNEMLFNTLPPKGKIYGNVVCLIKGEPVESAKLRLKGTGARKKSFQISHTDAHGFFACDDLDAETYDISVAKAGFKSFSQTVTLKEGEEKKIEIKLARTEEDNKPESKKDLENDQQKTN